MAPDKKLEIKLKKCIRTFRLSIDLHNSTKDDDSEELSFDRWFRDSVVQIYAHRIPQTIQYLCGALEIEDPWVAYVF